MDIREINEESARKIPFCDPPFSILFECGNGYNIYICLMFTYKETKYNLKDVLTTCKDVLVLMIAKDVKMAVVTVC